MSKVVSWRARVASLVSITAVAAGAATAISAAASVAAPSACSGEQATQKAAVAMAAACDRDVVITGAQSEYTRLIAKSDGRLRFESAATPQRVRRSDGSWAAIDLTLAVDGKGQLRPRTSKADVAFSAGGQGPLATVTRDGKKFTMLWHGRLPKPVVSGDSATYSEVMKGVDLVVRATRTGFTHVLVVKSPSAAASVRTVRLGLGGDASSRSWPTARWSRRQGRPSLRAHSPRRCGTRPRSRRIADPATWRACGG